MRPNSRVSAGTEYRRSPWIPWTALDALGSHGRPGIGRGGRCRVNLLLTETGISARSAPGGAQAGVDGQCSDAGVLT